MTSCLPDLGMLTVPGELVAAELLCVGVCLALSHRQGVVRRTRRVGTEPDLPGDVRRHPDRLERRHWVPCRDRCLRIRRQGMVIAPLVSGTPSVAPSASREAPE